MTKKETRKKQGFSSHFGFLVSAAGSAVGLSNIWRFPAQVSKYGGGFFLLAYLAFVLLLGYPLLLGQLALGRASQGGPYRAYSPHGTKWSLFSSLPTVLAFVIYAFYNVIIGWLVAYFVKTISGELLIQSDFESVFSGITSGFSSNLAYTAIIFALVAVISQAGVTKGVERVSSILMPLFIIIMVSLIGYAALQPGASKGFAFFLKPNWEKFSENYNEAILAALGQSFMSLSIGAGQIITCGGYANKKEPLARSAGIIVGSDTMVALMAGFFLFPFLFSHNNGVANATNEGEKLAFVCLPIIFQQMGNLGIFIGGSFFLLLIFAAITSSISLLEVPSKYMQERFGWSRKRSVWVVSLIAFSLSICCMLGRSGYPFFSNVIGGKQLMELLDSVAIDLGMTFSALCFSLFVSYQWSKKALYKELAKSEILSKRFQKYLDISITYIIPCLISLSLVISLIGKL